MAERSTSEARPVAKCAGSATGETVIAVSVERGFSTLSPESVRKFVKKAVAVLAALTLLVASSACGVNKAHVMIRAKVSTDAGPYTLKVDAYDNTTGEVLTHEDMPVVGEYGPSAVTYPSGHRVDVTVRIVIGGGIKIPMSSYIRLNDGGIGEDTKTCTPANPDLSSLECKVSTKF